MYAGMQRNNIRWDNIEFSLHIPLILNLFLSFTKFHSLNSQEIW